MPYGIPYVLAGSAGGSFKTGRPPNDLYVSIQNAFGITDTVFATRARARVRSPR